MARTAVEEKPTEAGETSTAELDVNQPVFAIGYDANGEAVDQPVDTRHYTQGGLDGMADDEPVEMFDGKPVTAWKYSLTGAIQVNRLSRASAVLFEEMRVGRPVTLLVTVEPGNVSFKPNTDDGHVVGMTRVRQLHVTEVFAADADASELFEGGLLRVKREAEDVDDGIGYMTQEPEAEPENDLASSLMAAGLCGKIHPGHLNKCRDAAHACELPEAG